MICDSDIDCGQSGYLKCVDSSGDTNASKCVHKGLFPILTIEIIGTVILTFLMSLSVMAGVGGGGIIVSFIMVFCKLDIKDAVAISGFTILVGSLSRFAMTYSERHPNKDAV